MPNDAIYCLLLLRVITVANFNFIPCLEINIYGVSYPIPSSNSHLCSTHNRLRCNFQNLLSIRANWKIVGSNCFGKLKIDGNLVLKNKVPPRSGSVVLRSLKVLFLKKQKTHEIKPTQKNKSEEWIETRGYLDIIYLQINKLLQITLENYMQIV